MRNRSLTIWVMVGVLCLGASQLMAVVEFKDGQAHNIDEVINDEVWVDYQAPGVETIVNLLAGGSVGKVGLGLYAHQGLYAYQDSRVNISGGIVEYELLSYGNAEISITDGCIGCGQPAEGLKAYGTSSVTLYGGHIGDDLEAHESSSIYIFGGSFGEDLEVWNSGQMTISGGLFPAARLRVYDEGFLTIVGSNFAIDGTPVGYGQYLVSDYPSGHLTGILANGDTLDNDFYIYTDGGISLTPEPATLLLLGLGAVMLRKKR